MALTLPSIHYANNPITTWKNQWNNTVHFNQDNKRFSYKLIDWSQRNYFRLFTTSVCRVYTGVYAGVYAVCNVCQVCKNAWTEAN